MNLNDYDLIIINSSGGKDSLVTIWEVNRLAKEQNFDSTKIIVSHQDLGKMEWKGTKELVKAQADLFGYDVYYSKRRDKNGYEETLLEYIERRKMFPSNKQRYCTSDFKRGPGARVLTKLCKLLNPSRVLYVFGFRSEESPARSKREILKKNTKLSTKKREVFDWLPVHDWNATKVWNTIKNNDLPYHFAYDLGMPRLSCVFCIFSPFEALVTAGRHNLELLDKYVLVEEKIGHRFREDFSIKEVKKAIESGCIVEKIKDWIM
ncbi:phosphoadenosine phosphosulfate reductase family protein [Chryseobacterium sp. 5_R23647]|uniref:phosphoadenosine phosphosulfate reductase domain-containing protein n=1 Tax=Chryseobacterium sp. 5_R23647 TaxID=2258964 RepID=UPI000E25D430|nr:phosphoadenosine phosphosulfate reductase family protein [Chryseobacterium sp. 5_R23647]REC40572.1 phosphoadenosine phosphosulfate reductase [Chryseobacterium sp. 5_R23647]